MNEPKVIKLVPEPVKEHLKKDRISFDFKFDKKSMLTAGVLTCVVGAAVIYAATKST